MLVQRCRDGKTAAINVEDNTYTAFYPTLSDEDYGKLTKGAVSYTHLDVYKRQAWDCAISVATGNPIQAGALME